MEQETIDRLNRRTDAERFGVNETLLNPCVCGLKPRVGSVCHGHGDFGVKIHCECGHSVQQDYFPEMGIEAKWNQYNPTK